MNAAIAISETRRGVERKIKVYTLAEYLLKEERSVEKHEFYNGQIVKTGNAKFIHNQVSGNTYHALRSAIKPLPTKYLAVGDGQKIYIEPENVSVYPDALVICTHPEYWNGRRELITNPLLIVEVLSRSTAGYDRGAKFDLYKLLPSFKEYVLIDVKRAMVETRFREQEDLWRIKIENDIEGMVALRSLGVEICLRDIYEDVEFEGK